jgi:hypothetical protein
MKLIMMILFSLFLIEAPAQNTEYIKFRWVGELVLKPRGTLLISIGKYIAPTDQGEIDAKLAME